MMVVNHIRQCIQTNFPLDRGIVRQCKGTPGKRSTFPKFIIGLFLAFLAQPMGAQGHFMLENFTGIARNGKVLLRWTMKKGESCYGTGIYRSSDGTSFVKIGEIPGDCGSTETAQAYEFTDLSPILDRTNQYTLELGLWGRTEPSLPLFVANPDSRDYRIIPHPITEEGKIYFRNPEFKSHTLTMVSLEGKIVLQQSSSTDVFHIVLNSSALPVVLPTQTEPYAFYISSETEILTHSGIILLNR